MIFACVGLLAVFGTASLAQAGFSAIEGNWSSDTIVSDAGVGCAPSAISLSVETKGRDVGFTLMAGSVAADMTFAPEASLPIFTEKAGFMARMGFSDVSLRERLLEHEPVSWARETEDGAVFYTVQIDKAGSLAITRAALARTNDGVFATLDINAADCVTGPLTTLLEPAQ